MANLTKQFFRADQPFFHDGFQFLAGTVYQLYDNQITHAKETWGNKNSERCYGVLLTEEEAKKEIASIKAEVAKAGKGKDEKVNEEK